jgi:tetratricopeptide (TPR) repeat protein
MTQISTYSPAVNKALAQGRLNKAISLLRTVAPASDWSIINDLNRADEDYQLVLKYAVSGAADPQRQQVIDEIKRRLYAILDRIEVALELKADNPSLFYGMVRYCRLHADETTAELLAQYDALAAQMMSLTGYHPADTTSAQAETVARRLFYRIWAAPEGETLEPLRSVWSSETLPEHFALLMVSALLMRSLYFFRQDALMLLLDAADSPRQDLKMRASVAALLIMALHPQRLSSPKLKARVEALRDTGDWAENVRMIARQFIRTRDTERITRKMRDELIPEMMKLRPEIYRRIQDTPSDPAEFAAAMEENPEWEELLNKSGLQDKIRELTELQNDGGDVMLTSFGQLKHFPFFNEAANWFLPFYASQTDVAAVLGANTAFADVVEAAGFLCDNDKYSLVLALSMMPAPQRAMLSQQIEQHNINMAELEGTHTYPQRQAFEDMAGRYVQDLYRFFHLFRRKNEFTDPFGPELNLTKVPLLEADFADEDTVRLFAEFYFKRGYYADALPLLQRLPEQESIWQKIGYAYQSMGQLTDAVAAYANAEAINPDSKWTLSRMATAYKQLRRPADALAYYRRLDAVRPDEVNTILNIGHMLLELGDYREALHEYYRAEFTDEQSLKPIRPIAFTALLCKDFETSQRYYQRLAQTQSVTPTDCLNMGHLSLATGNIAEAMTHYRAYTTDADTLEKAFADDAHYLATAGVDRSILPLIVDALGV